VVLAALRPYRQPALARRKRERVRQVRKAGDGLADTNRLEIDKESPGDLPEPAKACGYVNRFVQKDA
jgi:hypothetical protein